VRGRLEWGGAGSTLRNGVRGLGIQDGEKLSCRTRVREEIGRGIVRCSYTYTPYAQDPEKQKDKAGRKEKHF